MRPEAVTMMIVICTLVWGGFVAFLGIVWRIEQKKKRAADRSAPP